MKTHKHLVFINQNSGYLMIDIINAHVDTWDNITLITGKLIQRDVPLHPSVTVKKIIRYQRDSALKRLFTWGVGFLQIFWLVKVKHRTAHLYIVSNPPFALLLPRWCSNLYSLLVFDIYPDALVAYKILTEDSLLIKCWRKTNQLIFSRAENVFVLSKGMKKLVEQYVESTKITVTPLWTHNDFFKPVVKADNPFRIQHQLQDKFVVLYSGNMGLTHNLEVLVKVAAQTKNPDIVFLIIGEGEKKRYLQDQINALALTNCILLPWQEVSLLPYSMATADLGVVSLGKEASLLSVPSKTFNLLSIGVPLLCIADKRSELSELVNHYGCGKCFDGSSVDQIQAYIELVANNAGYRNELEQKSRTASHDFDSKNALKLVVS